MRRMTSTSCCNTFTTPFASLASFRYLLEKPRGEDREHCDGDEQCDED